jgi:hypothetical protein
MGRREITRTVFVGAIRDTVELEIHANHIMDFVCDLTRKALEARVVK